MISIVITCHGEARDLPIMLMCLDQQRVNLEGKHSTTGAPTYYAMGDYCTHEREIIIVSDGPYEGKGFYEFNLCNWEDIRLIEVSKASGKNVGHHTRGLGIEASKGDWIVLTNSDNLFVSGWLDRLVTSITDELGLIFWDCVHNAWRWSNKGGDGKHPGCQLKRGSIDLSCVAVRSEIAKKVGFPFLDYQGDYNYIATCARECDKQGLKIHHIPEILFIHQ